MLWVTLMPAITNHYYLELTPEQRRDPSTARLGTPSSSIGVRGRSPGTRRTARLLRTSTRLAVGCGGAAGLSRASWTTSRPAITPACATLRSSPGVLPRQGSSPERHPTTATTTAAATTTTTSTCIIGLGRSMTGPEPHHWLGQMVRLCTQYPLLSFRIAGLATCVPRLLLAETPKTKWKHAKTCENKVKNMKNKVETCENM